MLILVLSLSLSLSAVLQAGTYQLSNGQTISGEPLAPDNEGVIIKLDATRFTPRISWTNFTESALRSLAEESSIKPFVAPLLFDEPEMPVREKKRPEIKASPVPRVSSPDIHPGLGAIFSSPLSLVLMGLLYLANLYAAYQISWFRGFNPLVVVGSGAIVPLIGPLVFLAMPSGTREAEPTEEELEAEEQAYAAAAEEQSVAAVAEPAPAASAPAAAKKAAPMVYERGKFTFNRRFFETKLAGFLRVVPSEAEKDMVVVVESARGRHIGNRITRIMPNEIYLQVSKGGATSDVIIPFNEIKVVTVRHKDA